MTPKVNNPFEPKMFDKELQLLLKIQINTCIINPSNEEEK